MEIPGSTAAGANSAATGSSATIAENFDTFLTLLTTQLRFQDPLEPLNSNEFVAQLVQFTQVEQSIATNKSLEKLLNLQSTGQMVGALGLIGRTVEAQGNQLPLSGGAAKFAYTLDGSTQSTTLTVFDRSGNLVFSVAGDTAAGRHEFAWNGQDMNGNSVPDGAYTLSVAAKDADNAKVGVTTGIIGRVIGVESTDSGFSLSMGDAKVSLDDIVSVAE